MRKMFERRLSQTSALFNLNFYKVNDMEYMSELPSPGYLGRGKTHEEISYEERYSGKFSIWNF